jgi:predicted dehydrogenase
MPNGDSRRRFFSQLAAAGLAGTWLARSPRATAAAGEGKKPVGYALVGLGKLTQDQLIPAFKNTKGCRLTALVSGDAEKGRRLAAQNGVPAKSVYSYADFDRIADNPEVEIVYIVLPNAQHAEFTIRAARAGKHVLCEKPMAVSVAECEQMIAACKKAKRQLAIAYRLHFEPYNLELIRLARERELGTIKFMDAVAGTRVDDPKQWRLDKKLAGGGSLMDIGIYALQAVRYVSGEEPVSVSARQTVTDPARFKNIDETLVFSLTFPGGIVASCVSTYAARYSRFAAVTERGSFGLEPAFYYHGIRGFRSDGKPFQFPDIDQFAAEMDDFASCVRDGVPTRVPGEEGLRDVRIMKALYRSAETGREIKL